MSLDHGTTSADADRGPTERALSLLQAGVPLSLLLDLAMPVHSAELYAQEKADTSWVPSCVA